MSPKLSLAGQEFGRLTVIEEVGRSVDRSVEWLCRCTCGQTTLASAANLRRGSKKSCGCLKNELTAARNLARRKHGMHGTRIYRIWAAMIKRTTSPNADNYQRYGGRGIQVCDQWRTFENFYADMGPSYGDGLSIDRIDNDGHYEPGNVRWATPAEQTRNRSVSVWIEWRGHRLICTEWADQLGLGRGALRRRLLRGWPTERALAEGVDPTRIEAVVAELDRDRTST